MPVNESHLLDGINAFTQLGNFYDWSGGNNYIGQVFGFSNDTGTLNLTLGGSNDWRIETFLFYTPNGLDVNFTDADDAIVRAIDFLRLSNGNHTIELFNLDVEYIGQSGDVGSSMNLTSGYQRIRSVNLSEGNDVVTTRTGTIKYLDMGDGNDTVNMGDHGLIGALYLGDGSDTFNGSTGAESRVDSLYAWESGGDTIHVNMSSIEFMELDIDVGETTNVFGGTGEMRSVKVNNDGVFNFDAQNASLESLRGVGNGAYNLTLSQSDAVTLGSTVNTVTYTSGFHGSFTSYSGTNSVTIGATAEVRSIGTSEGIDTLTVLGRFDAATLGGNDDVVDMSGTARGNSLDLGGGNNSFTSSSSEYLSSLTAYDGDDTVSVDNANFNVQSVALGSGNNQITLADGWVGQLIAFGGDDVLTVTGGQITAAQLGSGDNLVSVLAGEVSMMKMLDGDDTINVSGDGRIEVIRMGRGDNMATTGNQYTDLIVGYEGSDTVEVGSGGALAVHLNEGDDSVHGLGYIDSVYAGNDNDIVVVDDGAGLVNLGRGDDTLNANGYVDFVHGNDGNDLININDGAGAIRTGRGEDTVNMNSDTWAALIDTGDDNDLVTVEMGRPGSIRLGNGDDRIVFTAPSEPNFGTQLNGGGGNDTVDFSGLGTTVTFTLDSAGKCQNVGAPNGDIEAEGVGYVSETGIDNVIGGGLADFLTGDNGDNLLAGRNGADRLDGLDGADTLYGDVGNDTVSGNEGNDAIYGGGQNDLLRGGAGDDTLQGGNGRDRLEGGDGRDLLQDVSQNDAFGQDSLFGGNGSDTILGRGGADLANGGNGNDSIEGGANNDTLRGGGQNDTLRGGDGADRVYGDNGSDLAFLGTGNDFFGDSGQTGVSGADTVVAGGGNDTIEARGGNDVLRGEAGADTFRFLGAIETDAIRDYAVGTDALEIESTLWGGALDQARLDAVSDTSSGTLVLDFGGGNSITFDGLASNAGLLSDIILV